jgi:hypothetical protein
VKIVRQASWRLLAGADIVTKIVQGALLLGLVCGLSVAQGSSDIVAKEPYAGTVDARVLAPDSTSGAKKESGAGIAKFVPLSSGRSRFEVQASIRRNNDSGFVIEGVGDASGWSGRSEALTITIDREGRIRGGGIEKQHRITFAGQATADRMDLTVETEKLAKNADDTSPVGTRIIFDYHLKRHTRDLASADTADATASAAPDEKKTCKRRVWKMRNVATPGGGMTMTQVPHCLD